MKKKILSLALALALCLSLCVPAFAAEGTTKVIESKDVGVCITIEGFLREDSYGLERVYVVKDNAEGSFATMEGFGYAGCRIAMCEISDGKLTVGGMDQFALGQAESVDWKYDTALMVSLDGWDPGRRFLVICESDFAKLKPVEVEIQCSDWAKKTIRAAYQEGLLLGVNYTYQYAGNSEVGILTAVDGCTGYISRANFARMMVQLYRNLGGSTRDVSTETPFTDDNGYYGDDIGYAYNLGFINGNTPTTFNPDATLTRQQAAAMLGRVYAKLYGDIPTVSKTNFADDASISNYAKSAVAKMNELGFILGMSGNRFAPTTTINVQQAVVIAYRMMEKMQ